MVPSRVYLLSLPERVIRAALGFSAGLLREIGEAALPRTVRRGQLYKTLVDTTLRYVIEQVGGAKGVYPGEVPQAQDFLARRGVGHAIELLGIAAFRISPVWVLAALADLSGLGRRLIPEIADALKEEGLLEKEAQFENVDQLLDGLEKTSSRLARTINAPPIDVASLRKEWTEIRLQARGLKPVDLPSVKDISSRWEELKVEAARQLVLHAAEVYDSGARADLEAGMAKLFASEMCLEVTVDAMRVHGGYGYSPEYDVERYYRDAPLMVLGEGTNEIQKNVIARQLIARNPLR